MKKLINPVMVVALLTLVSACKKVERIEVEPKSVALTTAGQKESLKATGVTEDGKPVEKVKFEFSSSDKDVATVDASGTVVAVKSGSASIEVKGNEKSAKVPVEVSIPGAIAVKGGAITRRGWAPRRRRRAGAGRRGPAHEGAEVEFASADAKVAEVSGNTVTAKGVGTTT